MQHSPTYGALSPSALAYELYVHDERYGVPTLHLLTTASESEARRVAEACLAETPHHRRVELWLGKRRIAAWEDDDTQQG